MSFGDYSTAASMRRAIEKVISRWMDRYRPAATYGTVVSWDNTANKATVIPVGQITAVTYGMGRARPTAPGNFVRIEGLPGDRYVSDVLDGLSMGTATGTGTSYVWNQTSAASTWTIPHGLGFYPGGIEVQDSSGRTVWGGTIVYTDINNLTITFSAAFSGVAYLS